MKEIAASQRSFMTGTAELWLGMLTEAYIFVIHLIVCSGGMY